ncbi:MAG TPA: hypothetical protein PKD64_16765 [Pirellulaceae bacterium]|mgnify:CR=1 FL=1|nr:hypothetical protein [Pirellulaceae bacterium]HMO93840.1 hypothetical protein [Pirellulaceae bacterium]HMP71136.1 hypothetical protein [Pirellulaceae bacterium]
MINRNQVRNLQRHFFITSLLLMLATPAWANNVRATREGALIKIFGDNAANQIVISQNAARDVIVAGVNGTTVNGLASVRFRNMALNAMDVRMGGGNDIVTISNLNVANDLFIDLGAGANRVQTGSAPSTIGANLDIEGGAGNDIVRLLGWSVFGDLYIDGKLGVLTAEITNTTIGFNLTVIGDASNDVVSVTGCSVGDSTSIETKGGADRVTVTDFLGYDLFVNTDLGADMVTLTGVSTLEDVGVYTGTQNDTVRFTDVFSGKNIKVSLDAGADSFTGINVFANYDAVFEGGQVLTRSSILESVAARNSKSKSSRSSNEKL